MWPYHPQLLERPVPRYTSFPTAAEFTPGVGASQQQSAIEQARGDVSLYVHIPYCREICWYCGCNTGAAGREQRLAAYLEALEVEIALVARALPADARVRRIAFGGGSPNALHPIGFLRLLDRLLTSFAAAPDVLSVELDPRGLDPGWGEVLSRAGITHASLGVQTFDPQVQAAIGRVQPEAEIVAAVDMLRTAGVRSLNFDLMYGLPHQNDAVLDATLATAIALAPERIALFGYAHVPHLIPRQRRIDATALPGTAQRFAMAARGASRLVDAGWQAVGFDHFALPHDDLAVAARDGTLRRNFQGFTDDTAEQVIGLGASAISSFPELLVQNEKNAGRYRMRLSQEQLTGAVGVTRTREDRERALLIEDLLCGRDADASLFLPDTAFEKMLAPFEKAGVIRQEGGLLKQTAASAPYVRSIAALFDPYRAAAPKRFSSAI